ncbi:MAG: hypothetical protein ACKO96_34655, partial [Flammeovirgaceae bacterium]
PKTPKPQWQSLLINLRKEEISWNQKSNHRSFVHSAKLFMGPLQRTSCVQAASKKLHLKLN